MLRVEAGRVAVLAWLLSTQINFKLLTCSSRYVKKKRAASGAAPPSTSRIADGWRSRCISCEETEPATKEPMKTVSICKCRATWKN